MTKKSWVDKWVLKNGSYKIVALFVALVLWIAILGRKDFILNHEVDLQVKLPVNTELRGRVTSTVKVKVGGPRLAIKRFRESNSDLSLDLSRAGIGVTTIRVQENDFVVPSKVRVISISPGFLSLDIRKKQVIEKTDENPVESLGQDSIKKESEAKGLEK